MIYLDSYIDTSEVIRISVFVVSGLLGMFYAYCGKWAELHNNVGIFDYMFGNPQATMKAVLKLIAMCAGAGGLSYLDTLTMNQIMIAGAGIGLLVPQSMEGSKKL